MDKRTPDRDPSFSNLRRRAKSLLVKSRSDVAAMIKEDPALRSTPVVFLTAAVKKEELGGPDAKIGGRTYLLYYEGSKLGLVAFKRDGASYWVANTLSRKLTEKQMLAIAKSLRLRKKGS